MAVGGIAGISLWGYRLKLDSYDIELPQACQAAMETAKEKGIEKALIILYDHDGESGPVIRTFHVKLTRMESVAVLTLACQSVAMETLA